MRGQLQTLFTLALVGPTLLVPVRSWHTHDPGDPQADSCAASACGGCATRAGANEDAREEHERGDSLDAPCTACAVAATIQLGAILAPPLIATVLVQPAPKTRSRCDTHSIAAEPRTRGPPATLPA